MRYFSQRISKNLDLDQSKTGVRSGIAMGRLSLSILCFGALGQCGPRYPGTAGVAIAISSTPYATPNWRRTGSKTSGDDKKKAPDGPGLSEVESKVTYILILHSLCLS